MVLGLSRMAGDCQQPCYSLPLAFHGSNHKSTWMLCCLQGPSC